MVRNVMKEARFYLLAGAIVVLLLQVYFRYRESPPTQWLWVVLIGTFLVSIWLASRKVRRGAWPHTRRLAILLLVISLVGGTAILCTVPDSPPVAESSVVP
ncbi:MAG: hypothetical protein FJ319_06075 [SAR202 cluster bacterium]|nr:hypothetical protein [SAR202 cluster bacterium]